MSTNALWTSLRGDFCIYSPHVQSASTIEKELTKLDPLIPKELERIAILPLSFFEQSKESIEIIFKAHLFATIFLIGKDHPINSEQLKLIPLTSLNDLVSHIDTKSLPKVLFFMGDSTTTYESIASSLEGAPPPNHLKIDLTAIGKNIDTVKSCIGKKTSLLVMVKAHGYGTEEAILCRFLKTKGIDIVGVAHVEEALQLRYENIDQALFIINVAEHEMEKALLASSDVGLYTKEQIQALEQAAKKKGVRVPVHLHIDTGMKRFGAPAQEALGLAQLIQKQPHLHLKGLFTHFPSSDEAEADAHTLQQIKEFTNVVATLASHNIYPEYIHMANSAAIFRFKESIGTMVRLGISLYGYSPSPSMHFANLFPSLTLETTISGILTGKKGETISYGRKYTIPFDEMKVAMLPLGYYDGLHRQHSNKQQVLINGHIAPVVGTICMDYMMVDVTHIPDVKSGDKAIVFGATPTQKNLCPHQFAERGGTILHELLTCLGPRIRRLFFY